MLTHTCDSRVPPASCLGRLCAHVTRIAALQGKETYNLHGTWLSSKPWGKGKVRLRLPSCMLLWRSPVAAKEQGLCGSAVCAAQLAAEVAPSWRCRLNVARAEGGHANCATLGTRPAGQGIRG